jgi:hypothetical protein
MPECTLKRPHRFLLMEEVRRLIMASEEPVGTVVLLAAMPELRIGKILALRWGGLAGRLALCVSRGLAITGILARPKPKPAAESFRYHRLSFRHR